MQNRTRPDPPTQAVSKPNDARNTGTLQLLAYRTITPNSWTHLRSVAALTKSRRRLSLWHGWKWPQCCSWGISVVCLSRDRTWHRAWPKHDNVHSREHPIPRARALCGDGSQSIQGSSRITSFRGGPKLPRPQDDGEHLFARA